MTMEKVSVIIPTWNRKKTLIKAVKSVLGQSMQPFEILICDDGSTDNTFEIIKSLNNPGVKWIAGRHSGLPAVARNHGIKEAKGEWIAFLDSNDEWFPEKLEKQMVLARQTGCLAICSNTYSVNTRGQQKKYLDYKKGMITFSDLIEINYVICSSAIIHSSLLSKCFGFSEISALKTGQDYAFWLKISTQGAFAYLPEPLVLYFDDPSKSNRRFNKNPYLQKKQF